MKKREPVSQIMTENVETVNLANTLVEAKEIMEQNRIKHLPVISGEKLIGILSLNDINKLGLEVMYEGQKDASVAVMEMYSIERIMTKNPISIAPYTTIKDATEIFIEKGFHALPVLDNGVLVGIVSTTDVLEYLLEMF